MIKASLNTVLPEQPTRFIQGCCVLLILSLSFSSCKSTQKASEKNRKAKFLGWYFREVSPPIESVYYITALNFATPPKEKYRDYGGFVWDYDFLKAKSKRIVTILHQDFDSIIPEPAVVDSLQKQVRPPTLLSNGTASGVNGKFIKTKYPFQRETDQYAFRLISNPLFTPDGEYCFLYQYRKMKPRGRKKIIATEKVEVYQKITPSRWKNIGSFLILDQIPEERLPIKKGKPEIRRVQMD